MIALLISATLVAHADDSNSSLKKYRQIYEQQLAKIDDESKKAQKQWPEQYLQSLKTLEDRLQQSGNLEAVLAVRAEEQRFAKCKLIPQESLVEMPQELRDLQEKTLKTPEDAELNRHKQVLTLAGKYAKTLEGLKQTLTQQGQIDQAVEVDGEIDALTIHPEVIAAYLALDLAGIDAADTENGNKPDKKTEASIGRTLPAGLQKGLVLYYSFDKEEGGKVTDKSGRGHDGAVNGAKWMANGVSGGAYGFDGFKDYIAGPAQTWGMMNAWTFSVWVKPHAFGANKSAAILDLGGPVNNRILINWSGPDDQAEVRNAKSTGGYIKDYTAGHWTLDTWNYMAVSWNGTVMRMYKDGIEQIPLKQVDNYGTMTDSARPLFIGKGGDHGDMFDGLIDEVLVYDRALSEQEIKQLFSLSGTAPKISAASGNDTASPSLKAIPPVKSSVGASPGGRFKLNFPAHRRYDPAMSSQQLFLTLAERIVIIRTDLGAGSGVCLTDDGYILTCNHVVDSSRGAIVVAYFGKKNGKFIKAGEKEATLVFQNRDQDVAVLKIDKPPSSLKAVSISRNDPSPGTKVYAIGSPGLADQLLEQSITEGLVSSCDRELGGQKFLQHSAAVNPGNSGGPLLTANGEIVGLVMLKTHMENVGFAIPATRLREVLTESH